MNFNLLVFVTLVISLSVPSVLALSPVEEVVVTGTTTEVEFKDSLQTVQIITTADIAKIQPTDLPSLLGRLSGVDFRDSGGRGSVSSVFVRGTASNAVVVLVDGIRSASATTGATALGSIPVEIIDRIEIVTGPLSSLYGANAMGGVIQIFTKRGTDEASLSGHARTGSFGLREMGMSVAGGNEKHSIVMGGNREQLDGFDRTDSLVNGNEDDDGFEETAFALSGLFTLREDLSLQLNYLNSENEVEFDNTFGADTGFFTENEIEQYAVKIRYQATQSLSIQTTLGSYDERGVTPAFFSDIRSNRDHLNVVAHLNAFDSQTFSLGYDYYNDNVPDYEVEDSDNTAVFAVYQFNYKMFDLLASVREDDNEAYGSDTNGGLSLSLDITEELKVIASVGTAFLAPTFNQLFFPNFSNPDLLPQESVSSELAIKWFGEDVQWRISVYDTDIDNQIVIQNDTQTVQNISLAEIQGIELEYNRQLGQLGLRTNLDYSEARDAETDAFLDDRAVISYNVIADYRLNDFTNTLALKGEQRRFDGGEELDEYVTVDWTLDYTLNDAVSLHAQVINIFDEDYIVNLANNGFSFNTQERSFEIGISYQLK